MGNMAPPVNSVRQNSMKIPRVDDWHIYDTRSCEYVVDSDDVSGKCCCMFK